MQTVTAVFAMERATRNTIRFEEVLESEFSAPKMGSIYVPKSTLSVIGWSEGKQLEITVSSK